MLLEAVITLAVIWLLVRHWKRRPFEKLYQQTKGSFVSLPIFGNLFVLLCNSEERMKRLQVLGRQAMKTGLLGFWFPHRLYLIIADAELAENILKTCLEKDDIVECVHLIIGHGSIFAPVNVWRGRRKLLAPGFALKNLKGFSKVFAEKSRIVVDLLRNAVGKGPVPMGKYYSPYSMDAISGTLGLHNVTALENGTHPFLEAMERVFNVVTDRMFKPWLHNDFIFKLTPNYQVAVEHKPYTHDFFYRMINEKREKKQDNNDGFKSFMESMVESPLNASNQTILQESFVLFGAGTDTSSVGLGYTSVLLARHPEVQERVYQEIKEVIGDSVDPITVENVNCFKYLDAVVRESLRLYPPVPIIARKIDRDITLPSGLTLLKGCAAAINIWAVNRNPKNWGEDADEFRPERFLDSLPENPAAFIPFSYGPRNCLGFQYAMISMKTSLSAILRNYRFVAASEEDKHKPIRVLFDVMMRDVDNYRVSLESRI